MKNPKNTKTRRQCGKCKRVKPLSKFPRNPNQYRGYGYYCKPCHVGGTKRSRERLKKRGDGLWGTV